MFSCNKVKRKRKLPNRNKHCHNSVVSQKWVKDPNPKALAQSSRVFNSRNHHSKYVTRQKVHATGRSAKKVESHSNVTEELLDSIRKLSTDDKFFAIEKFYPFNRGRSARNEEFSGQVQLHIISNSATQPVSDEVLSWLIGARNVFLEGLKTMNREYITKLVFDPTHKNLVLIQKSDKGKMCDDVIGSICFRMFPSQNFSEIVFIGVTGGKHTRGYGTHMMNHLKDYHIKHNICTLLTYAAFESIKFFKCLGFTDELTVQVKEYEGYIAVYGGAILMECRLEPNIVYTDFFEIVRRQKMVITKLANLEELAQSIKAT